VHVTTQHTDPSTPQYWFTTLQCQVAFYLQRDWTFYWLLTFQHIDCNNIIRLYIPFSLFCSHISWRLYFDLPAHDHHHDKTHSAISIAYLQKHTLRNSLLLLYPVIQSTYKRLSPLKFKTIHLQQDLSWLRRLVASPSLGRHRFYSRQGHVWMWWTKWHWIGLSSEYFCFPLLS